MKFLFTLLTIGAAGYGFWMMADKHPDLKQKVEDFIDFRQVLVLEDRYSSEQIVEQQRKEILKDSGSRYLESVVKYYPYLLLEVKYSLANHRTREGIILWDMSDGEMVLDTKHWKKTHGYADCMSMHVHPSEFKIVQCLLNKGGQLEKQKMSKEFAVSGALVDAWLKSCVRKNLVVETRDRIRLHLEEPKFASMPETKIEQKLVTKSLKGTIRVPKRFSSTQVERMAELAFGQDFTVRNKIEIYIPVHCIVIRGSDGSISTSHWNGVNGKRFSRSTFFE